MRPGGSGSPGITSSSPVENTATRSRAARPAPARRRPTRPAPARRHRGARRRPGPRCRGARRCRRAGSTAPAAAPRRRPHAVAVDTHCLLHDDGIGARGQRRTGEDACRRPGSERSTDLPCRDALGDRQAGTDRRDVGAAHRVAVHLRVVERRHVDRRHQVRASTRPCASSVATCSTLGDRLAGGQQAFQGFFDAQHGISRAGGLSSTAAARR